MNQQREVAQLVIDPFAARNIEQVASLPDNRLADMIGSIDADDRFRHGVFDGAGVGTNAA